MPPQARLKDQSFNPADAHSCPKCPHPVIGPATKGSPNVYVNKRPAVRVTDNGKHAACCGPNSWVAQAGSGVVMINGLKAHRYGDAVTHCGGVGHTCEGSDNVITGG